MAWLRKGIRLLEERVGDGPEIAPRDYIEWEIRIFLNRGDEVPLHVDPSKVYSSVTLDERGNELSWESGFSDPVFRNGPLRHAGQYTRGQIMNGIFYAMRGMKAGGRRVVRLAPHLMYGSKGLSGRIPHDAVLQVEVDLWVVRKPE